MLNAKKRESRGAVASAVARLEQKQSKPARGKLNSRFFLVVVDFRAREKGAVAMEPSALIQLMMTTY